MYDYSSSKYTIQICMLLTWGQQIGNGIGGYFLEKCSSKLKEVLPANSLWKYSTRRRSLVEAVKRNFRNAPSEYLKSLKVTEWLLCRGFQPMFGLLKQFLKPTTAQPKTNYCLYNAQTLLWRTGFLVLVSNEWNLRLEESVKFYGGDWGRGWLGGGGHNFKSSHSLTLL